MHSDMIYKAIKSFVCANSDKVKFTKNGTSSFYSSTRFIYFSLAV